MRVVPTIKAKLTFANVMSATAVALVLTTGTAYAAATITGADIVNGSIAQADIAPNSLGTNVIKDNGVKSVDIRDNEVSSADILDETIVATDLAGNSVGQSEIATDGVGATEIADDTIDSGEIIDFGLTNQDVGVLFAEVDSLGGIDNSSGGVTSLHIGAANSGTYEVDFGRSISSCAAVATIGESGTAVQTGEVYVADRTGNAEAVFITTKTSAGAAADHAFRLVVVC